MFSENQAVVVIWLMTSLTRYCVLSQLRSDGLLLDPLTSNLPEEMHRTTVLIQTQKKNHGNNQNEILWKCSFLKCGPFLTAERGLSADYSDVICRGYISVTDVRSKKLNIRINTSLILCVTTSATVHFLPSEGQTESSCNVCLICMC